jgi:MFS family permease
LLLGLTSAGTQAGAIGGALAGGWLVDRLGRRVMFLGTMMTISSIVAAPRYCGVASGFSCIHTKLPQFLGIFLFPAFFSSIGPANATFVTAIFPLIGLLAAIFILPEVYALLETRGATEAESQADLPTPRAA